MKNNIAVYGGTFDPPTMGHIHMIEKSVRMFDRLIVAVATGQSKKPSFTLQERQEMLVASLPESIKDDVEVRILPPNVYLVDYSSTLNAKFLVRGIRDAFDFTYENSIHKTNKHINNKVETIYLMPDENMSMVSSSWVKGLVGHSGWMKAVEPFISSYTLKCMALKYAKERFTDLCDNRIGNMHWPHGSSTEEIWEHYFESKVDIYKYHNVFHVLNCLDTMDLLFPQNTPWMEFAFWMHDIDPYSENDSRDFATFALWPSRGQSSEKNVFSYIDSTKHMQNSTGIIEDPNASIFASIDLQTLGGNEEEYEKYRSKVYEEYLSKSGLNDAEFYPEWKKGRIEFIDFFLKREYIYPNITLRGIYEKSARANLKNERKTLEQNFNGSKI